MKLKAIEAILKREKTIIVSNSSKCQWLGNGYAYYPVHDLPELSRDNVFAIFDVPADKRDKYHYVERDLPANINFEDSDGTESLVGRGDMCIVAEGRLLEPIITSQGLMFMDKRFLNPFSGGENGIELYERTSDLGQIYFVAKTGFLLEGVIMPFDLINSKTIQTFATWHGLSQLSLENKNARIEHVKQMGLMDKEASDS